MTKRDQTNPPQSVSIGQAIDMFIKHVKIGQSKHTVTTYTTALNHFCTYIEETAPPYLEDPVTDLTVDEALEFAGWLSDYEYEDGELHKQSLRTYLTAVFRLYAYIIRHSLIQVSFADYERLKADYRDYRKGRHKRLPRRATDEQIAKLQRALRSVPPDDTPRRELARLRNIAILETLRCTGVRIGELVSLRVANLRPRTQPDESHKARVIGKGDQERIVFFDDVAWQAVTTYLNARSEGASLGSIGDQPVFARHDKGAGSAIKPISTRTVENVFSDAMQLAGLRPGSITPHSLRHSFGTRVVEQTGNLAAAQRLLGHARIDTTTIYAEVSDRQMQKVHRRVFGDEDAEENGEGREDV